jgi:hypothetical protein
MDAVTSLPPPRKFSPPKLAALHAKRAENLSTRVRERLASMSCSTVVKTTIGVAIAIIAIGCGDPAPGDPAYKNGELGKGGFLFGCADGAACKPFSGKDTKTFPKAGVAEGATFGMRFVATGDQGDLAGIDFTNDDTEYKGNHVEGLSPFFGKASGVGIVGLKAGIGTLVARRASDGAIIDYTTLTITKPAKLVVYDADASSVTTSITSLTLNVSDSKGKRVRIVAQTATAENLAGSITHAWTFAPADIARVDSSADGVATFVGQKAGTTTATVTGGGLTQTVTVEVKP